MVTTWQQLSYVKQFPRTGFQNSHTVESKSIEQSLPFIRPCFLPPKEIYERTLYSALILSDMHKNHRPLDLTHISGAI